MALLAAVVIQFQNSFMKKASASKNSDKSRATSTKSSQAKGASALRDLPSKKSPVGGRKQEQNDK